VKAFLTFLFLVFFSFSLDGKIQAVFAEPINPTQLLMDDRQIYVVDFPFIYIYSKIDFSLHIKLGGGGEGPKRFQFHRGSLVNKSAAFKVDVRSGQLMVSSQGKLSFYSLDGTYEQEIRTNHRHDHRFCRIGGNFMGLTSRRGADNLFYIKLSLYKTTLEPEKDIFEFKRFSQPPNGDVNVVYDQGIIYDTAGQHIFVTAVGREGSVIDVLDLTGKKLYSIAYPYETTVVTEQDRARYLDYYRAGPLKYVWDRFKKQIRFPVHFPGLRNFSISQGKIYVLTFKKMKGYSELVVLDLKGNFLKKTMIPLKEKDIYYYPYCIYQEHFYQLVENADQEQWELEAWPIR
jgi:hypothetical protein